MTNQAIQSDQETIERITDVIINDPWISQAVSDWTALHLGIDKTEDPSEDERYWELYTFRLMELCTRAISRLVNHPRLEELLALEEGWKTHMGS